MRMAYEEITRVKVQADNPHSFVKLPMLNKRIAKAFHKPFYK